MIYNLYYQQRQIYQMSVKYKLRAYSQQPRYTNNNRQKVKYDKELIFVYMPSFQNDNASFDTLPLKLAQTSKREQKFTKLTTQKGYNKYNMLGKGFQGIIKYQQQDSQQQKIRTVALKFFKKSKIIPQLSQLFIQKDILQAKLQIKHRKTKPRETKKLIYFTKGNNHQILKEIFLTSFNFIQTQIKQNAHICWLQSSHQKLVGLKSSKSIYEQSLPQISKSRPQYRRTIYNYLDGQSQLTNKERLYRNMKRHYPQSIGNYIPKSFIIDFRQQPTIVQQSILQFLKYYMTKEHKKTKIKPFTIKNYSMEINITNRQIIKLLQRSHLEKDNSVNQHEENEDIDDKQEQIWILKPTSLNRGRGIHLFSSLKQFTKLLSQNSFEISMKVYSDDVNKKSYIIQQYIQRPLLIQGYKFDMRVYVFLNIIKTNGKKILKAHLFKHGYSRLASVKYNFAQQGEGQKVEQKINDEKVSPKKQKKAYINNRFIHLTNNAVQKQAKEYGAFCQGNQLSIEQTVSYFRAKDQNCPLEFNQVIQSMKKIVLQSVSSVKERLATVNTVKTFQLLGYDFLIDENYKMWLIEINCNPCLQQSSQLLSKLLRKMLSGMVVLTDLQESQITAEDWIQIV